MIGKLSFEITIFAEKDAVDRLTKQIVPAPQWFLHSVYVPKVVVKFNDDVPEFNV